MFIKLSLEEAKRRKKISNKCWYDNNKEHVSEYSKLYNLLNQEKRKLWRLGNSERLKEHCKKWREKCGSFASARYRSSKLLATPKWADKEEEFLIKEAYHLAKLRKEITGFDWHVDHIVPLQNKLVCGLHTILNLQVIPKISNQRKRNIYITEGNYEYREL